MRTDFPGQVTRDADCGLRQGFQEGPGEGPGLVGACARPGPPAGSQRGHKPRRHSEGRTVGATPAQGLWGDARVAWLRPEALEVRGAETPAEDPGKRPGTVANARRSGQPALSRGAELSRRHSPRAFGGAGRAEPWHSRPLAFGARWSLPRSLTSRCFWSLLCRLWGPALVAFFFSKQIFTKRCPRENALGHQCLRNCIRYKMLLNGSEIRGTHGHYIRASVHGEGLGLGATPDPMRSLSRGTWTVADRSPAPGLLKTPPGNCPCQMGRVRCRLIKGLARGQPCGRERSKVMSHSQPRTLRAGEGPPLSHPILSSE